MSSIVRLARHAFSILFFGLLAAGLSGCAHSPLPLAGGVEAYASVIAPAVFERASSQVVQGYRVESGILRMPDKRRGSLVVVHGLDGAVTALVDEPGKRGVLQVSATGKRSFTESGAENFKLPDTIKVARHHLHEASPGGLQIIDVLVGLSRQSANWLVDPLAFAIGQIETANQGLRNALVEDVQIRLAGMQIVDDDHAITGDTLSQVEDIFARGMTSAHADLVAAFFVGNKDDTATGWGYIPGRATVQRARSVTAFRHEIGHNASGDHCYGEYPDDDEWVPRFGYDNGKSTTILCGNDDPYYSNPRVHDQYGLPLGDTRTANMALTWHEMAPYMAAYTPALVGQRLILAGTADVTAQFSIARAQPGLVGFVALSAVNGPVQLIPGGAGYTPLTVRLKDAQGREIDVYFRGVRWVGQCPELLTPMNATVECAAGGDVYLAIEYHREDNPSLPDRLFSGELKLKVLDRSVGHWLEPVTVLISVAGSSKR